MSHIRIGQKVYDVDPVIAGHIVCLEEEVERLREFCYECEHIDGWAWCREMSIDEQREHDRRGHRDHCHFTPSRWQSREEASGE